MAEPMRVLLVADEPLDAKADGSKQRSLMATLPAGKAVKASSLLKKFAGHFGVDLAALELRTSRGDALGARDVVERDGDAAQTVLTVARRADAPAVAAARRGAARRQRRAAPAARSAAAAGGTARGPAPAGAAADEEEEEAGEALQGAPAPRRGERPSLQVQQRRAGSRSARAAASASCSRAAAASRRRRAPGSRSSGGAGAAGVVSVICPTTPERAPLHPLLYACFLAQTHARRELVVYDTGAEGTPSPYWLDVCARDGRVTYHHDAAFHMNVGHKRNVLVDRCKGDVVAMFDDDNFYAPTFIEIMLRHLLDSGARMVSLSGFYGCATDEAMGHAVCTQWEYYRNVGGRGETQLFWKSADDVEGQKPGAARVPLFDAEVTWGEEGVLISESRPLGWHRVWDDVHPDEFKEEIRDADGVAWKRAEAGVEWRPASRKEIPNLELLRLFDDWHGARRVFDGVVATPVDPEGEQAPDDWYDLPDTMKANIHVRPRRVRPSDVADLESDGEDEYEAIAAREARGRASEAARKKREGTA
ncbi:ribonuclease [Aureococcus anophagefferens]|nr:ribonuclease [Aureococcus anophagefferens]